MKTYLLAVSWQMYGTLEIEAESLEDAKRIAVEESALPDGDYLDSSFQVDADMTEDESNG